MLGPNHKCDCKRISQGLYKAGIPVMFFTTGDIQVEFERLSGLGVVFRKEPFHSREAFEAFFEDGFGNIVQLYQA